MELGGTEARAPGAALPHGKGTIGALRAYLRELERGPLDFATVIVPEAVSGSTWWELATHQRFALLLKAALLFPGVVVTDVPFIPGEWMQAEREGDRALEPIKSVVLIPVSAVHDATVQAIAYAKTLNAARRGAVPGGGPRRGTRDARGLGGMGDRHPALGDRRAVPRSRAAHPGGGTAVHGPERHRRHGGPAGDRRGALVGVPPARPGGPVLQAAVAHRAERGRDERALPYLPLAGERTKRTATTRGCTRTP